MVFKWLELFGFKSTDRASIIEIHSSDYDSVVRKGRSITVAILCCRYFGFGLYCVTLYHLVLCGSLHILMLRFIRLHWWMKYCPSQPINVRKMYTTKVSSSRLPLVCAQCKPFIKPNGRRHFEGNFISFLTPTFARIPVVYFSWNILLLSTINRQQLIVNQCWPHQNPDQCMYEVSLNTNPYRLPSLVPVSQSGSHL